MRWRAFDGSPSQVELPAEGRERDWRSTGEERAGRSEERAADETAGRRPAGAGSTGGARPAAGASRAIVRRIQREDVLARGDERRGERREREQDRDRVAVHRPDEAVEAVPAEALRASGSSTRGARTRAPSRPRARASGRRAGRRSDAGARAAAAPRAAAARARRAPRADDRGADSEREPERDPSDDEQARPAGLLLERERERARRERVDERARPSTTSAADGEPGDAMRAKRLTPPSA